MHEMSLVSHLFSILEDELNKSGMSKITKVKLKVGALSGAVPYYMHQAFFTCAEGTFAEGAELEMEVDPAHAKCRKCGFEFNPSDLLVVCERCGSLNCEVLSGTEVIVESVELE